MNKRISVAVDRQVKPWDTNRVVVDTHGRKGIERVFTVSGAEQMIRLSTCPVMVIRSAQGV